MKRLIAIASDQFGVFTRAQAHLCGVTDPMLRTRVRSGWLERLGRHVFRIAGTEASWRQRVLAACLAGGDRCVASHRTAAALHSFDGSTKDLVEVTVPRSERYRSDRAIVHQSLDLVETDCMTIGPIPVTTPARTLIDLGAVRRFERVEEAFDGAERDELVVTEIVARRHAQIRKQGRRGAGPMAVVLDGRLPVPPDSVLERRFVRLLEHAGLPTPQLQVPVRLANGRTVYIDAAYVELLLAFEIDGHGTHATRRARAADNARAAMLEDLGWQVRRFTYEQVVFEGPGVVRRVRAAIEARRPAFLAASADRFPRPLSQEPLSLR